MIATDCHKAKMHKEPQSNPYFSTIIMRTLIPHIAIATNKLIDMNKTEKRFIKNCCNHFLYATKSELKQFCDKNISKNTKIESSTFDIIIDYSHTKAQIRQLGFRSLYQSRFKFVDTLYIFSDCLSYFLCIMAVFYAFCVVLIQCLNLIVLFGFVYPEWHGGNKSSWTGFEGFNTMLLILHPTCKIFQYFGEREEHASYMEYMGIGCQRFHIHNFDDITAMIAFCCAVWVLVLVHGLPSIFAYYLPSFFVFIVVFLFFFFIFCVGIVVTVVLFGIFLDISDKKDRIKYTCSVKKCTSRNCICYIIPVVSK